MTICLDASFVVKLLLAEPDSAIADREWTSWNEQGELFRAPALLDYEVCSVLRLQQYRGRFSREELARALALFATYDIEREHDLPLVERAVEIAAVLNQPRAYDASYLAVAERYDAPLWTADERLANAAGGRFAEIRRLGE